MKKFRIVCLIVSLFSVMISSGCSKSQGQKNSFDPVNDFEYQYYQPDITLGNAITEDEKGRVYYIAGCNLYRYDPKTGKNNPLCNKTNCLHDKENNKYKQKECNSYFPYWEEDVLQTPSIYYENGYIYCIYPKKNEDIKLIKIKSDGSTRKNIHTFNNEIINEYIIHRGVMYYSAQYYDEDNKTHYMVKAFPLNGKEKEKTIYTPAKDKEIYGIDTLTAFGSNLYFVLDETDKNGTTSDFLRYRYDISDGKCSLIPTPGNKNISYMTFLNGKIIYDLNDKDKSEKYKTGFYNGYGKTYQVNLYEADLDGKNARKLKISKDSGEALYSDGDHLIVSDDGFITNYDPESVKRILENKGISGEADINKNPKNTATCKVYDKKYKKIDTYSEDFKGYSFTVEKVYKEYYAPIGCGDTSYSLVRNDDGTTTLYGGKKTQLGSLNGAQFKREKIASVGVSPAAAEIRKKKDADDSRTEENSVSEDNVDSDNNTDSSESVSD